MEHHIPAAAGTYAVAIKNGHVVKTPVIAWMAAEEDTRMIPVGATRGLLSAKLAILHPDGMVDDPEHLLTFGSLEEWVKVASSGKIKTPPAEVDEDEEDDDDQGLIGEESDVEIEWASSPYKTNSFYQYDDGEVQFLFQVPGGEMPPKQKGNVSKIKRDEFMARKKTEDVRELDDLLNTHKTSDDPEDEDDEDFGSDLI